MFWILQIIKRAAAYLQNLNVEAPRSPSSDWMADPAKDHQCEHLPCSRFSTFVRRTGRNRAHFCDMHVPSLSRDWVADPAKDHHRCENFSYGPCPSFGIYTLKMGLDRAHLCERHARSTWGVNPF
jgi:hypothetical protein